ncbi:MAG: response regulator [Sediminimonas qiaohouensis]|uniref:Response regulator n=1 Tax=Sediminimonas qiaohouensis TaxID=552061 RepID=A0A7C9LTF1_9RHOB|nr:response regulator [Sediminimonas qiaohouensis]MTJ05856.1 response regulator [Sediminimonas qiaohouensis]
MDHHHPTVLHVDDEEDIRVIAKLALETVGGLEVFQCASGSEALEMAPRANPDLFLLDVMMPDMDGVQTLKLLRELPGFEHTPAIFMTAKVGAEDQEELLRCGAAAVIPKPFDPLTVASDIVAMWQTEMGKARGAAATLATSTSPERSKQVHDP